MNEYQLEEDRGHIVTFFEYGNPDGVAILSFHGGPGSGSKPAHAERFDLRKYRVILFDQRGCGKSTPLGSVENNTTDDLLLDAERIREKLFGHLVDLSVDHFSEQKSGSLISRITMVPWNLDNGIMAINSLIREPITFVAALSFTLYTNWKLAILVFTIAPALAFLFSRTGRYLKTRIAEYQEKNGESFSLLQESISGIRILHLFNLQEYAKKQFSNQLSQMSRLMMKISKWKPLRHLP